MKTAAALVVVVALGAGVAHGQPEPLAPDSVSAQFANDRAGEVRAKVERVHEEEPPYVDLVTFGVGERLFEKFGHAAICLRYHAPRHVPICFNFGVTDFSEGAPMIWSFVRGTQEFWVEPSTWGAMYAFYKWEDRDIWLQTLPLTEAQARAVEAELWSALEGTKSHYNYDHFFENCTTRLRDLIDSTTGGKLGVGGDARYPHTFRELGRRGLSELPALVVLADFVLGRQLEDYPTVWEAMFHPTVLRLEIERRLGVTPKLLYKRVGYEFPIEGPTGRLPMLAVALVFALPLLVALSRRRVVRVIAATAYAGVLGYVLWVVMPALWLGFGVWSLIAPAGAIAVLAGALFSNRRERIAIAWATLHLAFWGIVIWGLAIMSAIPGVRWNEVVLVAMPFDLVLPFLGPAKRRRYAQVRVVLLLLVSLLCAVGVFRQPLWVPILTVFLPMLILALPNLEPADRVEPVRVTDEESAP